MEKLKKIYLLRNKLDGMEYIGQTVQTLKNRVKNGYKKGTKIREAIDKDGLENFDKEVLEDGLTYEEADERERYYIKERNTLWPNGYNLEDGGRHHNVHDETKQKVSEANKGCFFSEERRNHISDSLKGRKLSEEHKQHLSDSKSKKRVQRFTKNGVFLEEYPSVNEASRRTGINLGHICECLKGKRPTAGESIWKYA